MSEENLTPEQLKQNLLRMQKDFEGANERYVKAMNELREHKRVYESLSELNEDRIAYRLIGEVLTQQTVKDVKPIVATMIQQLDGVVAQMEQFLDKRQKEIQDYQIKNQIKL